jgi:hypothetical protein
VTLERNEEFIHKNDVHIQLFEALQMIEQPPKKTTLAPADVNPSTTA